ncbi:helix-turn-helix protein [Caprobacter fermentans]|uniref:Helix-turn-helix protein n=1 Tax=Caproicibacter fermentans TaxID=2576756 RepID=A0A6N8I0T0_9FIRM|nr:helix-turn-helix transcriptional regulator [Caproicibacter fermentans]MVB11143.1 helix-turn-helix protein [Caproicibacter fermentans]
MYEIFERLLKEAGITAYKVSKDTGISQTTLSDWKRGRSVPKTEKLQIIADYFDVSLDYLLGKTGIKKTPALTEKDERDISRRLDQTLSDLESAQGELMFDGEPLDDVTKELLIASLRKDLEMGKRIAKQKYTPKKYRTKPGD